MAREAVRGPAIFKRVNEMQKEEPGLTQQQAFQKLAQTGEFGEKAATIGANFYRVARQHGMTRGSARGSGSGSARGRSRRQRPVAVRADNGQVGRASMPELDRLIAEANAAIDKLAEYASQEAARIKQMRDLVG